jgi:nucleoside 2-deoxyribosyltransferase
VSVRIFLSYSHKSRRLAGELKDGLESFGFSVFLAHEDLKPSVPWRKEILKNLRQCDVFIPILTRGFTESDWTDQETGFALALKKKIIPVRVHDNPYGFIGAFQALKLNKNSPDTTCWEIAECLHEESRFAQAVKDGAIDMFVSSSDFNEVASRVKKLLRFRPFSGEQLQRTSNNGIYGCHAAQTPMRTLLEDAKGKVSRRAIRNYLDAVKSWPY